MANESSFYGEIIFFNKKLNNTEENRKIFSEHIDALLRIGHPYYGDIRLLSDDIIFNSIIY